MGEKAAFPVAYTTGEHIQHGLNRREVYVSIAMQLFTPKDAADVARCVDLTLAYADAVIAKMDPAP